jgi:Arc/MetJ-type ribon-helix-helix transcriptional regulator
MNISVDEASEQRIRREIELGHFKNPEEVIAHALELLESQETWLRENQESIRLKIERSFAQIERGEGVAKDEARRILATRKQSEG